MFSLSAGCFRSMPDFFHGVPDVVVEWRMFSVVTDAFPLRRMMLAIPGIDRVV
jgi:hypothetical protein